ncbi:MAG: arylesterase [Pseudomonadota bacterium]
MGKLLGQAVSLGYGAIARVRNLAALVAVLATPAMAEPVTVAALGDSLTQGYGLVQDQGFVPQLEGWLRANGAEVTVLNAGVSGDTTAGGLARVDWTLGDDVDALIVALGGNDLLRGIDPAVSRANLDGILQAAAARGLPVLLVGLEAPGNYGPDFKADFEAMFPDLATEYEALLYTDFLAPLRQGDQAEALQRLMQSDGIHPNAEGVKLMVDGIGPEVLKLIARVNS